jgi:hypothetical protein
VFSGKLTLISAEELSRIGNPGLPTGRQDYYVDMPEYH